MSGYESEFLCGACAATRVVEGGAGGGLAKAAGGEAGFLGQGPF